MLPCNIHLRRPNRTPGKFLFPSSKYFLFLLLFSLQFYISSAQRTKIESLKKTLPYLKDSASADCLNALSLAYTYLQADSAKKFSEKAYNEAVKINYQRGMIMSLNNAARIAAITERNFLAQEKICLEAIGRCKNLSDGNILSQTYMNLALSLFCQSDFTGSLDACDEALQLSEKGQDQKIMGEAIAMMASISFESGDYEKSFENFNKSLTIFKNAKDSFNTAIILAKIGDFYRLSGDDQTALNFYSQSLTYPQGSTLVWYPLADLGDTYYAFTPYDSTLQTQDSYLQAIKTMTIRSNYITLPKVLTAEKFMLSKDYEKAIQLLAPALVTSKSNNDKNQMLRVLFDLSNAYKEKKDLKNGLKYAKVLLKSATTNKAKQYVRDSYKLLYILYGAMHNVELSFYYFRQYTYMKDYVALDEFRKKLAIYKAATEAEKKQAQIVRLGSEKLISQQQLVISKEQLKNASVLKNVLIISVAVLALIGFIIFRNIMLKRKNEAHRHELAEKEHSLQKAEAERVKVELQQQATTLEMQALRAQMNPHFIFNCLNSINRFIIASNSIEAADHLTKFAKLIRIVLEQSGKSCISLEDELYCLRLYMDLEALRFEIPFQYKINTNGIDTPGVMIPSLLLQPFVENAIWHGLQGNKNVDGKISIDINVEAGILHCFITDNGKGRSVGSALSPDQDDKKKSLGIELTRNRLRLIDSSKRENAGIEIEDLATDNGTAAGTCVHIKIPVAEA